MNPNPSDAPSGWYPEYPGSPILRLWDGEQWTKYTQDASHSPPPPDLAPNPRTPVTNVFIWLLAALPLASALAALPWDIQSSLAANRAHGTPLIDSADASQHALLTTNLLVLAFTLVLSRADFGRLGEAGFRRRFPWTWGLLGTLVYVIGRTVIVYRQTGRGRVVLWIHLAAHVLFIAVLLTKTIGAIIALGPA